MKMAIVQEPSLPRMRGDRPNFFLTYHPPTPFTPHARGSTFSHFYDSNDLLVYPACAGIDHASASIAM